MRGQHLRDRSEGAAAKFARNRVSPVQIGIDHANQSNRLTMLFEFFIDAGVIAPEDAYANDGNRNGFTRGQRAFSRRADGKL